MILTAYPILQIMGFIYLLSRFNVKGSCIIHVFRNCELFDTRSNPNALLELIKSRFIDNKFADLSYWSERNGIKSFCLFDADLENIFCSKSVIDAFWKILRISSASGHAALHTYDQMSQARTNCIREMLEEIVYSNITCEEKFEIIKLLSFSEALENDMKFLWNFCVENDIFKLDNKDKVVEWVIDKAYETALQFEKLEPNLEAWEEHFTSEKKAALIAQMKKASKYEISFVSGAKFIFSCLDYIYEKTVEALSHGSEVEVREAFYLFCKMAASLSWTEIERVRLDENGKRLREIMLQMFNALEIQECILIDQQAAQEQYLNAIELIRTGKGMYYNLLWFDCRNSWIHIGSKTSSILKTYGTDFVEVFWKALGNIFRGLDSVPLIHLTISEKTYEEQLEPSASEEIKFDKFKYWIIVKDYQHKQSSGLSNIATEYRKVIFNSEGLIFLGETFLLYHEFACTVTFVYFLRENLFTIFNEIEQVLPSGRYMHEYSFLDKDQDFILQTLNESVYSNPDQIVIHLFELQNIPENLLTFDYGTKASQILNVVAEGLRRYCGESSNTKIIKVSVQCNVWLDGVFDLAVLAEDCAIYVSCKCHFEETCLIKAQCVERISKGERVIFDHFRH